MRSFRDESRLNWSTHGDIPPTREEVNTGALMRIADATEAMAKNHIQLQRDHDMYKRWYEKEYERRLGLERQLRALRGVISRMKNRATKDRS
ncbi:hypothetical protein PCO31111_04885 [Pandoraea communis]|uniref:Uncharacterized protein n=1 Tax=Pandoraea communis TaxID=2508297 RepID=A0A5E4YZP1_9BURK|nr:hypothetical protein [Pandoraea communis]VVE53383.1 hypothetical protein PCO31111_04885 [Pandoraea communis]